MWIERGGESLGVAVAVAVEVEVEVEAAAARQHGGRQAGRRAPPLTKAGVSRGFTTIVIRCLATSGVRPAHAIGHEVLAEELGERAHGRYG